MKQNPDNLTLFPEPEEPELSPEEKEALVFSGAETAFTYGGRRPTQCFTIKMPFDTYTAFKKEIKRLKDEAERIAPEAKGLYTMTNYVNSAVKHIIVPGLKRASVEVTKTATTEAA